MKVKDQSLQDLDEDNLDGSFEHYCQEVENTAAWGGQTELTALASALQHHIRVYAADLPVVNVGEQYQGTDKRICPRLCHAHHVHQSEPVLLDMYA